MKKDSLTEPVYFITALFNPVRFSTRWALYCEAAKRIVDAGGKLVTIEAAFGDRAHAVAEHAPSGDGHIYIQLRAGQHSELWLKENLYNLAVARLPSDWKFAAFVDADVSWARSDIVDETRHALQHYDVVQMYSHIIAAGPDHQPLSVSPSFGYVHTNGIRAPAAAEYSVGLAAARNRRLQFGTPGGAWAWRRSAFDAVGGFIDHAILGAADHYMALALVGDVQSGLNSRFTRGYRDPILAWQERAEEKIKRNIGYIDGTIWHHWHGSYGNRKYGTRASILIQNAFDPAKDLARDWQGIISLTGNKPKLRDDIRSYFRVRDEDSRHVPGSDYTIVGPKPLPQWE